MTDKATAATKRGGPPKGERPMSDSERQRAQRERDSQVVMAAAIGDEGNAPLRVLLAILARVEASESARLSAEHAWTEIGRRHERVRPSGAQPSVAMVPESGEEQSAKLNDCVLDEIRRVGGRPQYLFAPFGRFNP